MNEGGALERRLSLNFHFVLFVVVERSVPVSYHAIIKLSLLPQVWLAASFSEMIFLFMYTYVFITEDTMLPTRISDMLQFIIHLPLEISHKNKLYCTLHEAKTFITEI